MASRRHRSATRNEHDRVGNEEGNPVRAERAWAHHGRLHGCPNVALTARRGGGHQPGLVTAPPPDDLQETLLTPWCGWEEAR